MTSRFVAGCARHSVRWSARAAGWRAPAPAYAGSAPLPTGTDVDYQLGGNRSVPDHVGIVVRDREARRRPVATTSATSTASRPSPTSGRFWRRHPGLVLKRHGSPVVDEAWGEWLLDIRTAGEAAATWRGSSGAGSTGCAERRLRRGRVRQPRLLHPQPRPADAPAGDRLRPAAGRAAPTRRPGGRAEEPRRLRRHHDRLRLRGRRGVRSLPRVRRVRRRTTATGCWSIEYRRQDFRWTCAHFGDQLRRRAPRPRPEPDRECAAGAERRRAAHHGAGGARARWSPSATGSSGRARTGPRSPRRSPTTTGCCWSTCPTTGGRRGRDHFDYVDVADQVAELLQRGRPGRAGRPLDGRQGRDGAGAAAPRAGRAALRRRRVPGRLRHGSEFAGYIEAMQALDLDAPPAAQRRGRGAGRGGAQPDRAQLPAAEPAPPRRRAGPGSPTSTSWAATSTRSAAGPRRRSPAPRRTTGDAVGRRAGLGLRPRRVRRRDGPLVPAQPPGHDQGRRALGALRAAAGVHRGAAPVPG